MKKEIKKVKSGELIKYIFHNQVLTMTASNVDDIFINSENFIHNDVGYAASLMPNDYRWYWNGIKIR